MDSQKLGNTKNGSTTTEAKLSKKVFHSLIIGSLLFKFVIFVHIRIEPLINLERKVVTDKGDFVGASIKHHEKAAAAQWAL